MSKTSEFIKNTLILLVGKFSTQFMSFLLVPLYTKQLAVADYGVVDLIQTYITLFYPIMTLRLDSAAFRFLVDKRKDSASSKETISNIITTLLVTLSITLIAGLILPLFVNLQHYAWILANTLTLMTTGVLLQILRGQGKNTRYAIASIISGSLTLILNLIFIIGLKQGAESILISSTMANIVCMLYLVISIRLKKNYSPRLANREQVKEILKYSIPMIPHSLSWWIVNASDRTIISSFIGAAANGIYTVSCKISNILNSIFSIVALSWQESASLHINDKDRDSFFTNTMNGILFFFSNIALLILVSLPFVYSIVIGEEYTESYGYIPVLLYSNTWSILTGLIGGIYVAKKKTKEIANTTIISAAINIIIDLALVKVIGIHAATVSTLLSCMTMAIYRTKDCQKYVKFKLNYRRLMIFTIIFLIVSVTYLMNILWLNIFSLVLVVAYITIENKKNLKSMKAIFIHKRKEKNEN